MLARNEKGETMREQGKRWGGIDMNRVVQDIKKKRKRSLRKRNVGGNNHESVGKRLGGFLG